MYQKIDEQQYIELFKVLSVYFVADFENGDAFKCESSRVAYEEYRKTLLKKIRDNYFQSVDEFEY